MAQSQPCTIIANYQRIPRKWRAKWKVKVFESYKQHHMRDGFIMLQWNIHNLICLTEMIAKKSMYQMTRFCYNICPHLAINIVFGDTSERIPSQMACRHTQWYEKEIQGFHTSLCTEPFGLSDR